MNVMDEIIFEIRSCIEILANDMKVDTTGQYMLLHHVLDQCSSGTTDGLLLCNSGWSVSEVRTVHVFECCIDLNSESVQLYCQHNQWVPR